MTKYLKLEQALNKIATGNEVKGPFYQSAGIIESMSKNSKTVEDFIDQLVDYIYKTKNN